MSDLLFYDRNSISNMGLVAVAAGPVIMLLRLLFTCSDNYFSCRNKAELKISYKNKQIFGEFTDFLPAKFQDSRQ